MKVWVIFDTTTYYGEGSVVGIYDSEIKAKLALAEYILKDDTESDTVDISLKEMNVQ